MYNKQKLQSVVVRVAMMSKIEVRCPLCETTLQQKISFALGCNCCNIKELYYLDVNYNYFHSILLSVLMNGMKLCYCLYSTFLLCQVTPFYYICYFFSALYIYSVCVCVKISKHKYKQILKLCCEESLESIRSREKYLGNSLNVPHLLSDFSHHFFQLICRRNLSHLHLLLHFPIVTYSVLLHLLEEALIYFSIF